MKRDWKKGKKKYKWVGKEIGEKEKETNHKRDKE